MATKFITIEGIEGVGKSTNINWIRQCLEQAKIDFILTREPGGTPIAEAIRQIFLYTNEPMVNHTELLLMFAARAEHIARVIKPALLAGKWVICDRFTDASYAYQGAGRGISDTEIAALEQWIQGDLRPDLTFLLDAPVSISLHRAKNRGGDLDRIETEEIEFFERVRAGYLARAAQYPERYRVIQADQPLEQVQQSIQQILEKFIHEH